jgi:hypothetical protein
MMLGEMTRKTYQIIFNAQCTVYMLSYRGAVAKNYYYYYYISSIVTTWAPDSRFLAVSNPYSNSPKYSTYKAVLRYGPLRGMWCYTVCYGTMGHYAEYDCIKI